MWLMCAAAIGYVVFALGHAMTVTRYLRAQIPLYALVAGTLTLACIWFVPDSGMKGAALALVIARVVQRAGSLGLVTHALVNGSEPHTAK